MKTYVIILSKRFPVWHTMAGGLTNFREKFLLGQGCPDCATEQDLSGVNISPCNSCVRSCLHAKLHTIRGNLALWEKRIVNVQRGDACLSIREWEGYPYNSKQVEIGRLTKEHGVGLQRMEIPKDSFECIVDNSYYDYTEIARNDGLSPADWVDWFPGAANSTFAIIHFTNFRY